MADFQAKNCDAEVGGGNVDNFIKLKVIGPGVNEIEFRVKRTTKLGRLMETYKKKLATPLRSLRFLFDGRRLNSYDTPEKLEMKEGDEIEVYQELISG